MAKKKHANCPESCCAGTCESFFAPGSIASALSVDIPSTLFAGGGAGHEGGDCTTEECQERTGLFALSKVAWNSTYDCFGIPHAYKLDGPPLASTSCLWVTEGFSVCNSWNPGDPEWLIDPHEEPITFAWVAFADYDLLGPYIFLRLVRVCEFCAYWYEWRSAELTPGSVTWPVEMFRNAASDGGVCLGLDSCVIEDDETLFLELAV